MENLDVVYITEVSLTLRIAFVWKRLFKSLDVRGVYKKTRIQLF